MAIIYGTTLDDILNGTTSGDRIYGYAGNDVLNGGSGNDTLSGEVGNDTYIVDSLGDVVSEDNRAGGDRTISAANFLVVA
ncbi:MULTISPECIES: calcium-binding protein [Calothrix]|uniref:Uncharacterized protein n=2 Tax=Calothrix TaxID=1186 RepID=A0ABR8AHT4_9CYAN|nr:MULTISPECIES: hypothetical protein [Calothrix]MBD2199469.1 hypothetical protein [Calothrix parietina FACHB-288]MBD2228243.1 hypothetical protein [Calothrix anomala FACHB-343]